MMMIYIDSANSKLIVGRFILCEGLNTRAALSELRCTCSDTSVLSASHLLKSLICSLSICSLVVDIRVSDFTGLDRPPCLWHSGQQDPKCACFLSGGRGGASSSLFRCCFCQ